MGSETLKCFVQQVEDKESNFHCKKIMKLVFQRFALVRINVEWLQLETLALLYHLGGNFTLTNRFCSEL